MCRSHIAQYRCLTCSSHSDTELCETYVGGQEESGCVRRNTKDSGHIIYVRIRHSFAHVWTILNKMASFGVNIYRPSASEHGQNITNITMI